MEKNESKEDISLAEKLNEGGNEKVDPESTKEDGGKKGEEMDEPSMEKGESNEDISLAGESNEGGNEKGESEKKGEKDESKEDISPAEKLNEGGNEKVDSESTNGNSEKMGDETTDEEGTAKAVSEKDKPNEGAKSENTTKPNKETNKRKYEQSKEGDEMSNSAAKSTTMGPSSMNNNTSQQQAGGMVSTTTNSQQDRFVKISLKLPPVGSGKIGFILQDDKQHYGLPLLMALSPDSPYHNVIPPHLIGHYWVIGVKDKVIGESKILNSKDLELELYSRRKKNEESLIDITFASKSGNANAVGLPSTNPNLPVMLPNDASQIPPQMMHPNQTTMIQPQQQIMEVVAQQQLQQAVQVVAQQQQIQQQNFQQQIMMQRIAARHQNRQLAIEVPPLLLPGQQYPAVGNQANNKPVLPLRTKRPPKMSPKINTKAIRDSTIQRALSEFFAEGETRPLQQFCQSYSKLYSAISGEVSSNTGLREIRDKRKTNEAFSKEDGRAAICHINEMYSGDDPSKSFSKKRKKDHVDLVQRNKKTHLPPLKPKDNCKGLLSKDVEDYYANKNCENEYLYENAKLSNFQGWRHSNCLWIAELDKNLQCIKCRSAKSNLKKRHPWIFKKRPDIPQSMEEALLPKTRDIKQAIQNRIETLEADAVQDDPQLALASKVLKLKGKSELELDKGYFAAGRNLFKVCDDCGVHMLKKNQSNTSSLCGKCQKTRANEERKNKRKQEHKEDRVKHDSKVPFSVLSSEEAVTRFNNLKSVNKLMNSRLKSREEKDAKEKAKLKDGQHPNSMTRQNPQFKTPLLPWPFYLNYNPIAAQEYSKPATQASVSVAKHAAKSAKTHAARSKGDSPDDNTVKKSDATVSNGKSISGSGGNPPTKVKMEEMVTEDAVDEPLDHASIGSSQEEAVSPPNADSGVAANHDEHSEFDGHLV